ncbi:MAG: hypothetical protein U9M90_02825 [Patescibacteria group bacterium]|nr:hypothetical protein [Patescibacteria group bacterium]
MLIFVVILLLAVGFRAFYISQGIMPKTTDLGHHMYWSKYIVDFSMLPEYGMPDFIIGEHIIFSAISILSGASLISTMPVSVLLIVNIFSLLAIFVLTYRFSELLFNKKDAKQIALFSLLIIGCFYAISSPQSKFVSGGVIGNIIGNLFIPLAIYSLLQAIKRKDVLFAQLFIIFTVSLAYTHHLSTFILLYVLAGVALAGMVIFLARSKGRLSIFYSNVRSVFLPFFHFHTVITLSLVALFVFSVHIPSYLNESAINTAVGTPIKATRTGYTINHIIEKSGPWRMCYAGIAAIIILALVFFRKPVKIESAKKTLCIVGSSVIIMWAVMIFMMSWKPALLHVDIPSNRVVNYLTYPLSILSAIGAFVLLKRSREKVSPFLYSIVFLVILGTGFISAYGDFSDSARTYDKQQEKKVGQTFLASKYLNKISSADENILKDHIYIEGDTWIKLFFMRGYKYPLSRSFLKRYDDPIKPRETCTRDMIAIPDSETGIKCFESAKVKYVMLSNGKDTAQFERSANFNKIYASDHVVIFQRRLP